MKESSSRGQRARLRRRSALAATTTIAVAILTACSSTATSSTVTTGGVDISKVSAPILSTLTGAERTRVATLIAQARKEGEVDWLGTVVSESKASLVTAFEKEYGLPNLNVKFEEQQSGDVTARIQEEVTSNQVTTDLVSVDGAPAFFSALKQAGALLKYNSPELAAYKGSEKYVSDSFGYWVTTDALAFLPVYNRATWTTPIKSWYDLLDPKLKGKLSFPGVPTSASALFTYWGLRHVLPLSYFQDLHTIVNPRVGVGNGTKASGMVASGELTVAITSSHDAKAVGAAAGVPLAVAFPKEGAVMIGFSSGILSKSPHPAAAELLEDFVLSKAGQTIIVKYEGVTPVRADVKMPADQAAFSPATLQAANAIPVNSAVSQATLSASKAEFQSIFK